MLKRLTAALVTSLFMSQALIAPAHAGLFDFKLGGDKEEGQPSGSAGPDGAKDEANQLENATNPTARWRWPKRRMR